MIKLDLHMHSRYSDDGQYEPTELLQMCKKAGLDMMAVADHNSVRGSRIALHHQAEYGITCIPAIEIDAVSQNIGYHILGYGIDVHHPVFDEIEEHVASQEREASRKRKQLVRKLGIDFDEKRIQELSPEELQPEKQSLRLQWNMIQIKKIHFCSRIIRVENAVIIPLSISTGISVRQENRHMWKLYIRM